MRKQKPYLIIIVTVLMISASLYYYNQVWLPKSKIDYGDVSVEQAVELIKDRPSLVILDVRTLSEFEEERLENAINIPVDDLQQRVGELNKNDELLVYCRTGNRSSRAVQILQNEEFHKIFHMAGGIVAWKKAGHPTTK